MNSVLVELRDMFRKREILELQDHNKKLNATIATLKDNITKSKDLRSKQKSESQNKIRLLEGENEKLRAEVALSFLKEKEIKEKKEELDKLEICLKKRDNEILELKDKERKSDDTITELIHQLEKKEEMLRKSNEELLALKHVLKKQEDVIRKLKLEMGQKKDDGENEIGECNDGDGGLPPPQAVEETLNTKNGGVSQKPARSAPCRARKKATQFGNWSTEDDQLKAIKRGKRKRL